VRHGSTILSADFLAGQRYRSYVICKLKFNTLRFEDFGVNDPLANREMILIGDDSNEANVNANENSDLLTVLLTEHVYAIL